MTLLMWGSGNSELESLDQKEVSFGICQTSRCSFTSMLTHSVALAVGYALAGGTPAVSEVFAGVFNASSEILEFKPGEFELVVDTGAGDNSNGADVLLDYEKRVLMP